MADVASEEPKIKKEKKPTRTGRKTTPKKKSLSPQSKLNVRLIVVFVVLAVVAFLFAANLDAIRSLFIVANVNGQSITRFQVIKELEMQGGQQVLDSIISRTLIEQEAKKQGIAASDLEIQEETAKIEATLLRDGTSLDDALAMQGMTRVDLAEQLKFQVLLDKLLADKVEVSDEQLEDYIEANKNRIAQNQNYYRRRQAIIEHPYGTIKRQWGFNYIMTSKTIHRASADVGLVFTAYNLRRILNIIGKEALRRIFVEFFIVIFVFLASLEQFWRLQKNQTQNKLENLPSLQRKYLLI